MAAKTGMRNIRARFPTLDWTTTGLNVTTDYGIHFDPFDNKRQFITYTDIGLFRSEDAGKSWVRSAHGIPAEWSNTTYWVAFDPKVRGRMWSVDSGTHDLPRPKMWRRTSVETFKGGVCRSDDGGRTWKKSNAGMPETAATDILLDPNSPPDARVLYVTGFGRGVYKSSDGGATWNLKNTGITQHDPFAWRLARASNGDLYVVLARRSEDGSIGNDGDGALYKSTDGAETWTPVTLPHGVNGPNGLAIDPQNPQRLYLAAWARAVGEHGIGGGIYLSNDGGKNWQQVLRRDQHIYDVTIDPRNPDALVCCRLRVLRLEILRSRRALDTHRGAELQMDASRDSGPNSPWQNLHHDIWRRRLARRCKCATGATRHRHTATPTRQMMWARVTIAKKPSEFRRAFLLLPSREKFALNRS